MRNTLRYIYIIAIGILIISSCRNEDEIRIQKYKDGANVKVTIDPKYSYLNFEDLANAKFAFDVKSTNKDMEKVEFFVSYKDYSEDSLYDEKVITVTSFPVRLEYTSSDIAALFNLPGGASALGGGDLFNFRTKATLKDGRTFDASNSSPTMVQTAATSSFTSAFGTFVGCPSSIQGTYTSITTGKSTDSAPSPNPTIDFASEVTLVRTGPTTYTISNAFGGLYLKWYGVYGVTGALTGGTVNDICGIISVATFSDPFGGGVWGEGSVNNNGTLTINWTNEYDDEATTVYKKK